MEQILLLINGLPNELQILISEYNVQHRPKMNFVLRELTMYEPYTLVCEGCGIAKIAICHYSYIAEAFICPTKSTNCLKKYVDSLSSGHPSKKAYDDILYPRP